MWKPVGKDRCGNKHNHLSVIWVLVPMRFARAMVGSQLQCRSRMCHWQKLWRVAHSAGLTWDVSGSASACAMRAFSADMASIEGHGGARTAAQPRVQHLESALPQPRGLLVCMMENFLFPASAVHLLFGCAGQSAWADKLCTAQDP